MRHPCIAALICALAMLGGVVHAQAPPDRSDAERRLQVVRSELKQVAAERRKLENQRGDVSRKLRDADQQVGGVQRSLQQTRATLQRDGATLQQLQAERALTYQGYLQRGQVQRIRVLSAELQRIDALEREIVERRDALDRERRKQAEQLLALQQARQQRAGLLAGIDQQYRDRAGREKALGRDAKALQDLLARLRAAAAKAARDAARAKAEASRKPTTPGKPSTRRATVASAPALRVGGLGWPVAGSLLASFGGRLPDGRRSDGVLIGASAGTTVKAVADGTVVYADWMTGYGNILIIDHGNGYMSLYAHNDGLLKDAGDAVKRGDSVASVGTSGGQDSPALYFELRRNGAPVNPAGWLTRQ